MNRDIREYASIGLVHHMLYPRHLTDEAYHSETLKGMIDRTDIETIDFYLPFNEDIRRDVINHIVRSGKESVYAAHAVPSRKISLCTASLNEIGLLKLLLKDQISVAAAAGASGFIFISGADIPDDRESARERFHEFCLWFCSELKPHGICAMLEPFDREVDKKYLFGPLQECSELMEKVSKVYDNIGIELDIAHLPLMGESFSDAVRICAPYLKRVHLGNCVLKDKSHPLFGDTHPPIGYKDGEIDTPELAEMLSLLLDCGYLSREKRGAIVFEMTPFPGKSPEFTITDAFRRLNEAWSRV